MEYGAIHYSQTKYLIIPVVFYCFVVYLILKAYFIDNYGFSVTWYEVHVIL